MIKEGLGWGLPGERNISHREGHTGTEEAEDLLVSCRVASETLKKKRREKCGRLVEEGLGIVYGVKMLLP